MCFLRQNLLFVKHKELRRNRDETKVAALKKMCDEKRLTKYAGYRRVLNGVVLLPRKCEDGVLKAFETVSKIPIFR